VIGGACSVRTLSKLVVDSRTTQCCELRYYSIKVTTEIVISVRDFSHSCTSTIRIVQSVAPVTCTAGKWPRTLGQKQSLDCWDLEVTLTFVLWIPLYCMVLERKLRVAMTDTSFPLVLRNRSLALGVSADITTRTTKGSLGGKAPIKSTSLGASQQGGTASSLLKTCLLVGKLVFWRSLFSFSRHQIRSLGRRRHGPESLGSKEIEMGIEARSLGLLLITTTYSPYATSWSCTLQYFFFWVGWLDAMVYYYYNTAPTRKRSGALRTRRPPRSHILTLTHRTRSLKCCVSSCWPR
jgi:hypothetical protein